MTGTIGFGGRLRLSGAEAECEAALIDLVVEMVLALEPLEHKQHGAADGPDAAPAGRGIGQAGPLAPVPESPTLVAESTQRMLAQMRAVLDREAARLGADGSEGKAAVDQVSLIARTLEKIDQMERLIAEDQARATARTLSADEREQLRQTVRQLILAAAERLAAERLGQGVAEGDGGSGGATQVSEVAAKSASAAHGHEPPDPADAGSMDPGSRPG
ncbi:MAG: hypothetical protein KUA43_06365 [Hoeflea sp.]|uniref:hypothetical protein n=1 Tax=Hoeflea sp. TaxID=1940281 RepID=UPI001D879B40|nr:hypothetical protein [Hoeflea sp.]MBU4530168.1 hypothetical protein [Alphaproteobacteria bacterium]MBU4542547.1 hypothetical protein [Alphaproteobacteria bacterium]MBU4551228.1 hypothetical protein [Alphaproteobacteria bacterium]MBV1723051.1 hypothetical protein [Hoeflea sp.]MBV1760062.1 hypothetical protein [Hoeflea sp.]